MTSLIQQLDIDRLEHSPGALETIDQISAGLHGYEDNGPVRVSIRSNPTPEYDEQGKRIISPGIQLLQTLKRHKVIIYRHDSTRLITDKGRKSSVYRVYITNRYLFEQLVLEIDRPYIDRMTSRGMKPGRSLTVDNIIYYNPSNGRISVNGKPSRLKIASKYKSRAIFNLLLRYAPKPAPREEVLEILKLTSKKKYTDTDRTYAINKAVDSLRDTLKTTSDIVSITGKDLYLNATIIQVEKLPENFRFTD